MTAMICEPCTTGMWTHVELAVSILWSSHGGRYIVRLSYGHVHSWHSSVITAVHMRRLQFMGHMCRNCKTCTCEQGCMTGATFGRPPCTQRKIGLRGLFQKKTSWIIKKPNRFIGVHWVDKEPNRFLQNLVWYSTFVLTENGSSENQNWFFGRFGRLCEIIMYFTVYIQILQW